MRGYPTISPFSIIVLFLAMAMLGAFVIWSIPLQLTSPQPTNRLTISYLWPNNSSVNIEQLVTTKIEGVLSSIKGIDVIESLSSNGKGSIAICLTNSANSRDVKLAIKAMIDQLYPSLPQGVTKPKFKSQSNFSTNPLLVTYAIMGYGSKQEIESQLRKSLLPLFRAEKAISAIKISGGKEKMINITYDLKLMGKLGIVPADVTRLIARRATPLEFGTHQTVKTITPIRLLIGDPDHLSYLPIAFRFGKIIYLHQVATLHWDKSHAAERLRVNGLNALTISFYGRQRINEVKVAALISRQINTFQAQTNNSMLFEKIVDPYTDLRVDINQMINMAGYSLIVMFFLMTLVFTQWSKILLAMIAYIFHLLITILLLTILQIKINLFLISSQVYAMITIFGNLIFIFNNISFQKNSNHINSIVIIQLIAILPISGTYYFEEKHSDDLTTFLVVLVLNLLVFFFIARWFEPACRKQFLSKNYLHSINAKGFSKVFNCYRTLLPYVLYNKRAILFLIAFGFGLPIQFLTGVVEDKISSDKIDNKNRSLIHSSVNKHFLSWFTHVLGGSFYQFEKSSKQYFHSNVEDDLTIKLFIKMQIGSPPEALEIVFKKYEAVLEKSGIVTQFICKSNAENEGIVTVKIDKNHNIPETQHTLKGKLINVANGIGNASCTIIGVDEPFSNQVITTYLGHAIKIKTSDYKSMTKVAKMTKDFLLIHPRITAIEINDYQSFVATNHRTKSFDYSGSFTTTNHASIQINAFLSKNKNKTTIAPFNLKATSSALSISNGKEIHSVWALLNKNLYLDTANYLNAAAHIKLKSSHDSFAIRKENQQYISFVSFNFIGEHRHSSFDISQIIEELERRFSRSASFEQLGKANRPYIRSSKYLLMILLGLVVLACTGIIYFNSMRIGLIMFIIILIGYIGIFLSTSIFNFTFDHGGYIAFLTSGAIVSCHTIILLDAFINIQKENPKAKTTITFLRVINTNFPALTCNSTLIIAGLAGFALFSNDWLFWKALSIVTICAIIFSWLAMLFVLPLFLKFDKQ